MLLQLPNELIGAVLSKLHRRDLINVSTCNQLLHSLVTPILYSNLVLPVSNTSNKKFGGWEPLVDRNLMRRLLRDGRKYGKYVRRLRVVGREKKEAPGGKTENRSKPGKNSESEVDEIVNETEEEGGEDGISRVAEWGDDTTAALASQIYSLIQIDETRLTSFKWLLDVEIPLSLLQKLVGVPENSLSTLEILDHGNTGSVSTGTLPEGGLPCLRKLVVQGIYSPQRVAELHYILRASPNLQSFGFSIAEEARPEAQDDSFEFGDREIAGIGLEADDFGWKEPPTHWADFIETCIFKNLQRLPLKKLMVGGIRPTAKMAKCMPLESLRHLSFRDLEIYSDFIEALDMENLRLETCDIIYERSGGECLLRSFIGDLRPGLQHLGFVCSAWYMDPDIDDHDLESEYPGLFSLPEEFTERQKGTLETITFNVLISDWQAYEVAPNHSRNFKPSSEFSKITEISVPLLLVKNEMQEDLTAWKPITIALDDISGLPNLRILTLNPISTEYREDFIEKIFATFVYYQNLVDQYQQGLVEYVKNLAGTYATKYGQAFGLDRGSPPLEWVFVVGGEYCEMEVGFQIKWRLGEGRYDASITMLSGIDARKLVKTEDMRLRKYGLTR